MTEPITGQVAKILTSRELVINRGSVDGVQHGMRFEVLDPRAENIEDPVTGETLGSLDRPKVKVEVSDVSERLSVARTYESMTVNVGGSGIGAGMKLFQAPQYEKKYATLKTEESTWEDLDEKDSFVKTGDPVRQLVEND